MGEEGPSCQLTACITLANPFDWLIVQKWLNGSWNKHVYNFILTKSLVSFLQRHKDIFRDHETISIDEVLLVRDLQDYDEKITIKLWGFESVSAYYKEASSRHYLSDIRIPMLCLQALDDPIVPKEAIPYEAFMQNPNLILVTTDYGGHISWLEGLNPTKFNWADNVCMEFVHSILDHCEASTTKNV